jgi:AraC-like DNA-binding protein
MDDSVTIERLLHINFYNAANAGFPITPLSIVPGREIVELLSDGEVYFPYEGRTKKFSRGTIFWHIAGEHTIWDTTPASPYKCAAYHFIVNKTLRTLPRVSQWRGSSQSLDDFIRFTRNWYERAPYDPKLRDYCYSVLSAHAVAPEAVNSAIIPGLLNIPAKSHLIPLLKYIEENISTQLDIEHLCEIADISRNHLFRQFKRYLGATPHNYILDRRIANARRMLEETPLPIKEVAQLCGFDNIEVFYRIFRQHTAMPPGSYRKQSVSYDLAPDKNTPCS